MGAKSYLPIALMSSICLVLNACDQSTGDLLRSPPTRSQTPRFETISQGPQETDPERAKKRLGDANKTDSVSPPAGFLPTGPDPFPVVPPTPTDDDFFADNSYIEGPSIPYGVCGNGHVDFREQCDDGNDINDDGCNVLCQWARCGNGVIEKNEECDDGNEADGDGCNHRCDFERCGNKCLDFDEQCDDGNLNAGDGCSPCCLYEVCGNKTIDPLEGCDDGNTTDGDGCSRFCEREVCGNGTTTPNEQCDDGNTTSGDGCSSSCMVEVPGQIIT